MVKTKATLRRIPAITMPRNIQSERRRILPFKIEKILPETKIVSVKKNGQKTRDMSVRRKAIYFSGKNRRLF